MITYIDNLDLLKQVLKDAIIPYYEKHKVFCLDIETFSTCEGFPEPYQDKSGKWLGHIRLLQLGGDPRTFDNQWLIDVRRIGVSECSKLLKPIIENSLILGHNLKYDLKFLIAQMDIYPERVRDTMLLSQIILAGKKVRHKLHNAYSHFLDWGFFQAETGMSPTEYAEFKEDQQQSDWSVDTLDEDQLKYAAQDVRLVFFLYEKQKDYLERLAKKHNAGKIQDIVKLECALVLEFALMELRGIEFDTEYHQINVIDWLSAKTVEFEKLALTYTDPSLRTAVTRGRGENKRTEYKDINLRSHAQIKKVASSLGIELPDTTEKTLKLYRDRHPFIGTLIQFKEVTSLNSKFGRKMIDSVYPDGKIHASFFQIGSDENAVDTGRSSCSDPNMMQMPSRGKVLGEIPALKLFRTGFKAGKNNKLIDSDYSQIEPTITAQITKDAELVSYLNTPNPDTHGLTAKALLGLAEIPARGTFERDYVGKTANLALSYSIGPKALMEFMYDNTIDAPVPVRWTLDESKQRVANYFEMFVGIKEKMQQVEYLVRRALDSHDSLVDFKGRRPVFTMVSPFMNRHRTWYLTSDQEILTFANPDMLNKHYRVIMEDGRESNWNEYNKTINRIAREAYNFLIQGEAANIFKLATLEVGRALRTQLKLDPKKYGIVLVCHDELLVEVPEDIAEEAAKIIDKAMVDAGKKYIKLVPVKADPKIVDNWAQAK